MGEGRSNQRRRTRHDLLKAAARLMQEGRSPTLEDVAAEALVSRATAYRYFSGIEPLLLEAALDLAFPDPAQLFGSGTPSDPVERMQQAEAAVAAMVRSNEPALRMMLIHSLQRVIRGGEEGTPDRQNRRTPLIEAALAPALDRIRPNVRSHLVAALALIVGTEAMLVFKDVLQMDDEQAAEVKRWAIRALVEAAVDAEMPPPAPAAQG